jgi:hypothetical protein
MRLWCREAPCRQLGGSYDRPVCLVLFARRRAVSRISAETFGIAEFFRAYDAIYFRAAQSFQDHVPS